jgi:hypothetical protein
MDRRALSLKIRLYRSVSLFVKPFLLIIFICFKKVLLPESPVPVTRRHADVSSQRLSAQQRPKLQNSTSRNGKMKKHTKQKQFYFSVDVLSLLFNLFFELLRTLSALRIALRGITARHLPRLGTRWMKSFARRAGTRRRLRTGEPPLQRPELGQSLSSRGCDRSIPTAKSQPPCYIHGI